MKSLHAAVLDSLIRVQRFLDANGVALGPVNTSGARKSLDDVVTQLSGHAVDQGSHTIAAVGQTEKQASLRAVLRTSLMQPVADMARANREEVPDVADLRMPSHRIMGTRLVAAAEAMADASTPYAAVFVSAGLRPDFVDALRAGAAALRESLGVRVGHQNSRKGATIGLESQAVAARKAIRKLNAAVNQQLAGSSDLLKQWQSVKRVPKKPGTVRGVTTSATSTSPTTSTATTALLPAAAGASAEANAA